MKCVLKIALGVALGGWIVIATLATASLLVYGSPAFIDGFTQERRRLERVEQKADSLRLERERAAEEAEADRWRR